MAAVIDDSRPIFLQIAALIENDIVDGNLPEEAQIPSTNELAAFHRINPATAAKGVNLLVEAGILYKRRGIGMFVSTGARAALLARRTEEFFEQYVRPLAAEARKLGIPADELSRMIIRGANGAAAADGTKERSAAL
ncbi:GntR family transcriptional regulator [Pseudarthrobacter sulfonivorans]|uniref:GntR family transcriptional regulator n=1 Tax=Pseudarthrobacter sulfonivorans TaxID=121292 RepID=UPI00285C2182|nr:GntR family transcriptional regulator [Pseudarthrobacter sulfonivorans]MDR6413958.1 DNA-binding transcriptional regulator YhcF (GntR family) [Pseudarthrobacter sulfonivorans]